MRMFRRALLFLALMLCTVTAAIGETAALLLMPENLTVIDEEAFAGSAGLHRVVLQEGAERIEGRAFANSTIAEIELPESLSFIAEDAFADSDPVLYVVAGTYAHEWALMHDYRFVVEETPQENFTYLLSGSTASITGYTGTDSFVVIPETIEGCTVTSISSKAFSDNKGIEKIALNHSMETIGESAFYDCSSLNQVLFTNRLKKLENRAFSRCTALQKADLPDGVTHIGDFAFEYCANLKSFHYPASWTKINDLDPSRWHGGVFMGCASLKEITVPEGVTTIQTRFFSYADCLETIHLPSTLTSIGERAFWKCTAMTSIDLPDSVTSIGNMAFGECTFESITLPKELTTIGSHAFSDCTELKDVVFNSKLERIEEYAFIRCENLLEADLPDSVIYINNGAFEQCESLNSFHYPASWTKISDLDPSRWYGAIFKDCTSLKEITVPEGVTTLPTRFFAFANCLETIHLPSTLTSIGERVFWCCDEMASIDIPDTVTFIGNMAFGESGLETIAFSEELLTIDSHAFAHCKNLTDVAFNQKLERIEEYAFIGCESLLEADLPDSVVYINNGAFEQCESLNFFHYPASWTRLSDLDPSRWYGAIFKDCTNLKEITVPEGVTTIQTRFFAFANCLETIHLPSTLTAIGERAFWKCSAMPSIDIPNSVTSIGTMAFGECTFESITLPKELTTIGSHAFSDCTELKDVVFNSKLERIEDYAFLRCKSLLEADLPDSVIYINNGAFEQCESLNSFHYPASWTKISDLDPSRWYGAIFKDCASLKEITVPEGVTAIQPRFFAFANCLETIHLPSTLTAIGERAFWECSSMPSIDLPNSVTSIGSMAFSECTFESITLPKELTIIGSHAFSSCTELKDVVFNSKLERIEDYAFIHCRSLLEADLPDSVVYINDGAFEDCESLNSFHYPASWTKINDYDPSRWYGAILKDCTNLTSVTVPNGITELFPRTFRYCNELTSVQLPSTLRTISDRALAGCPALGDIYIAPRVSSIDDYAFEGWENLKIYCEWGTAALSHAQKHGIPHYYLSATGAKTLSGFHAPSGVIYKGDPEVLHGYIRSSINIEEIVATLYDASGEVLASVTSHPQRTVYNTSGFMSEKFRFSDLALGTYRFTLSASTAETQEMLVDNTFTVVPPPLRVTLRNLKVPEGYLPVGTTEDISGTIVSNYPLVEVEVSVYKDDVIDPVQECIICPGQTTFDLTNISLALNELTGGQYRMIIDIQANGEWKQVSVTEFILSDIMLPEGTSIDYEAMNRFVADHDNKYIFNRYNVNYRSDVIGSLDEESKFILGMYSKDDTIINDIIDGFELLMFDDTSETKLVKLYKKEIAAFLTELGQLEGAYTYNKTIAEKVSESYLKFGKIETSYLKEQCEGISDAACDYFESLNDLLEDTLDAAEATENIVKVAVFLSDVATDYTSGLAVLEAMEGELNSKRMSYDFQLALRELEQEYASRSYRAVSKVFDYALKEFAKETSSTFVECILKAVSAEVYVTYKVIDLAWDTITECTGLYDEAKSIEGYLVKLETYSNANSAYQRNYETVYGGDTSTEAITQLILSFDLTKAAAIRALEALDDLNCSGVNDVSLMNNLNGYRNLAIE